MVTLTPGERVVIRYRLDDGMATDALGYVSSIDATQCVVETKRGAVTVPLADVIASKLVPPPPAGRRRL